jgi:hypothetical protein
VAALVEASQGHTVIVVLAALPRFTGGTAGAPTVSRSFSSVLEVVITCWELTGVAAAVVVDVVAIVAFFVSGDVDRIIAAAGRRAITITRRRFALVVTILVTFDNAVATVLTGPLLTRFVQAIVCPHATLTRIAAGTEPPAAIHVRLESVAFAVGTVVGTTAIGLARTVNAQRAAATKAGQKTPPC